MTGHLPSRTPHGALPYGDGSGDSFPLGWPHPDGRDEDHGIDLRALFLGARRHAWLVALVTLVGLGVGIARASKLEPRYRSTGVLQFVETERALAGGVLRSAVSRGDPMPTRLQVLRSQAVLGPVVDSLGLRMRPVGRRRVPVHTAEVVYMDPELSGTDTLFVAFGEEAVAALMDGQTRATPYGELIILPRIQFRVQEPPDAAESAAWTFRTRRSAVSSVAGSLGVSRRSGTDILDISFTAGSPDQATRVVNEVMEAFQFHDASSARQSTNRHREFLEEQSRRTDSLLLVAQDEYTEFHRRWRPDGARARIQAFEGQRVTLDVRRAELQADRMLYSSLLSQLEQADEAGVSSELEIFVTAPGILSNPIVSSQFSALVDFSRERRMLTVGEWARSPDSPEVAQIDSMIAITQRHLTRAVHSYLAGLEAMDSHLERLDSVAMANIVGNEPAAELAIGEARLNQQVQMLAGEGQRLRQELRALAVAEVIELGQVQILEPAHPPNRPLAASGRRMIVLGLLVGFLVGVAGALTREALNTTLRRSEDLERDLRVPSLAVVPRIHAIQSTSEPRSKAPVRRLDRSTQAGLVTFYEPRSPAAEAFRALRTNLVFSNRAESIRSVLITSSAPEEGKSTVAANLAVAFAQQGLRTLVMDCDIRSPTLDRTFGTDRRPGLVDWLTGRSPASECLRETGIDNLHFLPAGTLPENPVELLGGDRMTRALLKFEEHFDMVILDCCPLVGGADPLVLGVNVGGVVLVARADRTETRVAMHTVSQLNRVGAQVLGVVLNDPDDVIRMYGSYGTTYGYPKYKEDREGARGVLGSRA